jgi:hypothetical protein
MRRLKFIISSLTLARKCGKFPAALLCKNVLFEKNEGAKECNNSEQIARSIGSFHQVME